MRKLPSQIKSVWSSTKQSTSRLSMMSNRQQSKNITSPRLLTELSEIVTQCNKADDVHSSQELMKQTNRVHESFMNYKEDIVKVI